MSDTPEKTSLSDTLASLLLENRQAIGLALFNATQRALAAHQTQQLQMNHRADIFQRQVVELFTRLARPQAASPDSPPTGRSAPRGEDSEIHAELDALKAERARIHQESVLLRARQARAREEMELEQLRRETEAMEASLRDLRSGKGSTADDDPTKRSPKADDLAAHGTPRAAAEQPTQPPRATGEPAPTGSPVGAHIHRITDKAGENILAAQACLGSGDFSNAIFHADNALIALRNIAELAPDHAVGLLPLNAAALSIASQASIELGEIIRGLDLLDESIEAARAIAERDPTPNTIVHHIRELVRRGDLQLKLGRVDEATQIYQDAHTRLQRLADHAPSERVLNEIVLLSRKLDSLAAMYRTH